MHFFRSLHTSLTLPLCYTFHFPCNICYGADDTTIPILCSCQEMCVCYNGMYNEHGYGLLLPAAAIRLILRKWKSNGKVMENISDKMMGDDG